METNLAIELRSLVHQSVALLGEVIQRELGKSDFRRIESLRRKMTELRGVSSAKAFQSLQTLYRDLESSSPQSRHSIAKSFTLMLELMNACENAYRSYRLTERHQTQWLEGDRPKAIIYVLTAHPTEARSPQNIAIFHQIQALLIEILQGSSPSSEIQFHENQKQDLFHLLEVAWRVSVVRNRSPKVKDEAEHIYSMLFRDGILFSLLETEGRQVPFYVRSWVGGDKDGHPGVDEKVLLQSLNLSRKKLLRIFKDQLKSVKETLELIANKPLQKQLAQIERQIPSLQTLKSSDARSVSSLREKLNVFRSNYEKSLGSLHPQARRMCQLLHAFPGFVVPLELRESSDVLMSRPEKGKKLAIERMLEAIARVSKGGDPRWYARGFIISMTESLEHIQAAARKQKAAFAGKIRIPVIPLFEEASSLAESDLIMKAMLDDLELQKAAREYWDGLVEMMVGYSDSSKESGVLASRLAIARALPRLEKVCEKAKFTPLFFHGSGGSVDRGGGSIEDQTAWWPRSALTRYKVTVQGEMVERSLATPAIAKRQIEKIIESATRGMNRKTSYVHNETLERFAQKISEAYGEKIQDSSFLSMVEAATPYSYLNLLKIGSRPAKRTAQLTVKGLRAIPWVLCWTQTRVLFQTWWGVGSAWRKMSSQERDSLKKAFREEPVFHSYLNALGFTLAKVEMPVWKIYLKHSNLLDHEIEENYREFDEEYQRTVTFFQEVCEKKDFLWFRPWLGESIELRSPMIHPLNILQILAQKDDDVHLLRLTVTGISSGMLTTG